MSRDLWDFLSGFGSIPKHGEKICIKLLSSGHKSHLPKEGS